MKISLVVAVAENGVIGRGGELPWHLPADLKHFKALTLDHTIVMGRKTWESIGRPLPRRRMLVISRQRAYRADGVEVVASLDAALARATGEPEIFVVGGAELFREALPRADRLHLTRVHAEVAGDVFFPAIDQKAWHLVAEERHPADERHAYPFSIRTYERRRPADR